MEIYKITNLVNDKVYIGQSARSVQERFHRHIQDAVSGRLDTHFARAIRKYGPENFMVEVIDDAETQEELNQKEQNWIRHYDSVRRGYNETDAMHKCGGNTYMSKNVLDMYFIRTKIRDTKIGGLNPHARKVKCRSEITGEELIFDTMKECQEYFGESNHLFISRRVLGAINSLYLAEWNFAYLEEPYREMEKYPIRRTRMILLVTDLKTNRSVEYPSLNMLSKTLGVHIESLRKKIRRGNGHTIFGDYQIDILD